MGAAPPLPLGAPPLSGRPPLGAPPLPLWGSVLPWSLGKDVGRSFLRGPPPASVVLGRLAGLASGVCKRTGLASSFLPPPALAFAFFSASVASFPFFASGLAPVVSVFFFPSSIASLLSVFFVLPSDSMNFFLAPGMKEQGQPHQQKHACIQTSTPKVVYTHTQDGYLLLQWTTERKQGDHWVFNPCSGCQKG